MRGTNVLSLNFKGVQIGGEARGVVRLTQAVRPGITGICVPLCIGSEGPTSYDRESYFFYGNREDLSTIGRSLTHIEQFIQMGLVDRHVGALEEQYLSIPNRLLFSPRGLTTKIFLAGNGLGEQADLVWPALISLGYLQEEQGIGIIQETVNADTLL
ncbi:MAG: hypothetical protein AABZ57_01410, partial [Candidatus Margulisiibacteriota bacterium]